MYSSFKDMQAWQDAVAVAERIHFLTDTLPKKEDYGFTSQIRRSALSIAANIAEAFGRRHTLDKINFYYNARGSLTETQSHIEYGCRVKYFDHGDGGALDSELVKLYHQINKIISGLESRKGS